MGHNMNMTKSSSKIIKNSITVLSIFAVLIVLYNLAAFLIFKGVFVRDDFERTAEHEVKFYAGQENYDLHLSDLNYIESLSLPEIEVNTADGLNLKALLWEADSGCRGSVILMHGHYSSPLREFAGIARFLHDADYNVILPFQRSHGKSQGKYITFGLKERYDVREWILKINELYGQDLPLFLYGISMGSSTVTYAAALDLPPNLRGVIADCGYTEPYEILYWTMTHTYHLWPGLSELLLKGLNFYCRHLADFDLKGYSGWEALNKTYLPFLFITGTEDKTVPHEMTVSLFFHYKQIYPDSARLFVAEGAPHAVSYMIEKEKYKSEVLAFIKKYGS
jgi:pimeloyl-ACP methyl ester carboxylesterase